MRFQEKGRTDDDAPVVLALVSGHGALVLQPAFPSAFPLVLPHRTPSDRRRHRKGCSMTDPRIEAAQKAIEGGTPGPFSWYWQPNEFVPDDSGLISNSGGGVVLNSDAGYWPEDGSPDTYLIAIGTSVLPAALRLAAAVEELFLADAGIANGVRGSAVQMLRAKGLATEALTAFRAALPPAPEEGDGA